MKLSSRKLNKEAIYIELLYYIIIPDPLPLLILIHFAPSPVGLSAHDRQLSGLFSMCSNNNNNVTANLYKSKNNGAPQYSSRQSG